MATADDLALCRDTRLHRLTRGYAVGVGHPAHDALWERLLEEFELLSEWHDIQAAHEATGAPLSAGRQGQLPISQGTR